MTIQIAEPVESGFAPADINQLISMVAHGDKVAFNALYEQLSPRVHGIVRRTLIDDWQSQEVTQDIFLEIWRTAAKFSPSKGSGTTWVMMMAHGRAVDRVRSVQASRVRDRKVGIRDLDVNFDPVAEAGETSAESARVVAAMKCLTELQRNAISMTYFEGLSGPELAARLDIPLATIKSRIREALIRLRDELGTQPEFDGALV